MAEQKGGTPKVAWKAGLPEVREGVQKASRHVSPYPGWGQTNQRVMVWWRDALPWAGAPCPWDTAWHSWKTSHLLPDPDSSRRGTVPHRLTSVGDASLDWLEMWTLPPHVGFWGGRFKWQTLGDFTLFVFPSLTWSGAGPWAVPAMAHRMLRLQSSVARVHDHYHSLTESRKVCCPQGREQQWVPAPCGQSP